MKKIPGRAGDDKEGSLMDKIYRSGIGFDVHKLVEGRKCIIGGVDIPYEKGLLGHSDADVLLHAISDALLGAHDSVWRRRYHHQPNRRLVRYLW